MHDEVRGLIIQNILDLIDGEEVEISVPISGETNLYGSSGILDSMGLVSVVIAIEQAIEDTYHVRVSLADEKALSQKNSPFRTVDSLVNYACSQIITSESKNG